FRLAAKTKAAREGGWLQFLQEFKTEKSSKSSDNPNCCRSQLGLKIGVNSNMAAPVLSVPLKLSEYRFSRQSS
ncbi:hypothetical protein, partial [Candidatus Electronema sp. TJ]|uniref:hypothetical protein n=1 Tax=Candidatus Electronema sp. TJ TaxID=3401573 RepID=UPI003AA85587